MCACYPAGPWVRPQPLQRPAGPEKPTFSRSTALGCLASIAVCVVVGVAVYPYMPATEGGHPTMPRVFAGIIGMVGGLGLHSLFSVVMGHGRGAGSRKALLARALSDGPPADGQLIVATGVVHADRPLTSPLGGVSCAAYDYRMFTRSREGTKHQKDRPVYWGYAAQPFSIDSASRRYPVSGVPLTGDKATPLSGDAVVKRARDYVRSTGWETVEFAMLDVLDAAFHRLKDTSTTGTRRDFGLANDAAPDVVLLRFEETALPIGATVSALGQWSASRGAIIPRPDSPVSLVIVVAGGPEALDGQPGMPQSTTSYVIGAIVAIALSVGLFYLARIILPTVETDR